MTIIEQKAVAFLQGKDKYDSKVSKEPKAEAPAAKTETKPASTFGAPTSLSDMGSINLAKPAVYKINVDNQTYFAEVEQLG